MTDEALGVAPGAAFTVLGWRIAAEGTWIADAPINNPAVGGAARLGVAGLKLDVGKRQTFRSQPIEGSPIAMPLTFLDHGVSVSFVDIDYDLQVDTDEIDDFTSLGYRALFDHRLADSKWSLGFVAGATLSADKVSEADLGDLEFVGGPQATYHFDSGLSLGLGLYYQEFLGEPMVLPFPFVRYMSGDRKHRASIAGPRASYAYGFAKGHSIGLFAQLSGYNFKILSQTYADHDADGNVIDPAREVALAYSSFVLGPSYVYSPMPLIDVRLEGGWVFARRFEFVDQDSNDPIRLNDGTVADFDPSDTWQIKAGAGVRF